MKLIFIFMFLLILPIYASNYQETAKTVNIRVITFHQSALRHNLNREDEYYVLEEKNGDRFYLKHYIKGKKHTFKTINTKIEIGKKTTKTEGTSNYYAYNLKCLKYNDVYFNCIER